MIRPAFALAAVLILAGCGERAAPEKEMSAEEVAAQLASVKIDPGQWETTTEILSAKGPLPKDMLDAMVGRREASGHCITPEQAARPSSNFLAAQRGSDCTYQDFRMQGGKLNGRMTCTGGQMPGEMVTTMSGDYGPQGYDMVMDMETPGLPGGAAMRIKARTQGRRVGECT